VIKILDTVQGTESVEGERYGLFSPATRGSVISSPSGVRVKAPAENGFAAF